MPDWQHVTSKQVAALYDQEFVDRTLTFSVLTHYETSALSMDQEAHEIRSLRPSHPQNLSSELCYKLSLSQRFKRLCFHSPTPAPRHE